MTPAAPLGSVRIVRVVIGLEHSAVVLLAEETLELYEWLRGQRQAYKGKAKGNRFRLTIDGVSMDCRRVFVRWKKSTKRAFVTVTSWPGDTAASVFGRKVGRAVYSVELVRTAATRKQGELKAKEPGQKRVTVEEAEAVTGEEYQGDVYEDEQ